MGDPRLRIVTADFNLRVTVDEESLRTETREYLSNKGYQVIIAQDFDTAVEASSEASRRFDLLVTDALLPGASGPKLERLAASRPEMKVPFVFGYTADALVHGDLHQRDFAFLSKPLSLDTLARKIRTILDTRRHRQATEFTSDFTRKTVRMREQWA